MFEQICVVYGEHGVCGARIHSNLPTRCVWTSKRGGYKPEGDPIKANWNYVERSNMYKTGAEGIDDKIHVQLKDIGPVNTCYIHIMSPY